MGQPFDYNPPVEEQPQPQQPVQQPAQQTGGFTTLEDIPQDQAVSQADEFADQPGIIEKEKVKKPYNWQEDMRVAVAIGAVGFIIAGVVFYYLFHSVGVI